MTKKDEEGPLIPEIVSEARQKKVGAFLIRESLLDKMRKGIDQGLAFVDAAEAAGIPYELVLHRLSHDDEMREWYQEAAGRQSIIRDPEAKILPSDTTPLRVKREFVRKLYAAGLFDKIAELAAHADVTTADGRQILGFYMKYVLKEVLPKETASQVEISKPAEISQLSTQELLRELNDRREKRLGLEDKRRNAADGIRRLSDGG